MKLREHPLLEPHLGKSVTLDSNLLLLDWCCSFDPALLNSFNRLNNFAPRDAMLLSEVLKLFPGQWTTPHILTEVSNLANSLPGWIKDNWFEFFSKQIRLLPESYGPSSKLASDPIAIRFGLTDAALARLASTHFVLTADWPLSGLLESRHLPVLNFNYIRELEFTL
jgi:hypothetical protein